MMSDVWTPGHNVPGIGRGGMGGTPLLDIVAAQLVGNVLANFAKLSDSSIQQFGVDLGLSDPRTQSVRIAAVSLGVPRRTLRT